MSSLPCTPLELEAPELEALARIGFTPLLGSTLTGTLDSSDVELLIPHIEKRSNQDRVGGLKDEVVLMWLRNPRTQSDTSLLKPLPSLVDSKTRKTCIGGQVCNIFPFP